jgi:YVTN family beta-propeller protein
MLHGVGQFASFILRRFSPKARSLEGWSRGRWTPRPSRRPLRGLLRARWLVWNGSRISTSATLLVLAFASPALADEAFVTNQGSGDLTIVDLATMNPVATVAIGGKPAGVAVSPDGTRAYVTSPEGKFLSVIDARERRVLRRIPLEGGPLGLAVTPDGKRVFVADMYDGRLYSVDPEAGVVATAQIGATPSGVAVTPDGRTILVTIRDANRLAFVDAASFQKTGEIEVGRHPFGVTIDSEGRRAYAANVESDDVSVIDIATRAVVGTVKVGKRPYCVALAQGRGFVTDQYAEAVSVFDLSTLAPVAQVRVGEYPEGIGASRDGKTVYVANWFTNEFWSIGADDLKVTAKAKTGDGPRAFGAFIRVMN